jgi:formylglycine-generating enzyme required for sulfatase activity
LVEQPQLFGKHSQGNHLLISRQDLQNPMASPLMQGLELSNDLTVHKLISLLKSSLLSSALHLANLPKILPEGEAPKSKEEKLILPEMVFVEGGTFMMGATEEQEDGFFRNGKPVHLVTLDSFEMGKYEVTNEQFCVFLNSYGSNQVKDGEYKGKTIIAEHEWGVRQNGKQWQAQQGYACHSVIHVSWHGANAYTQWLSTQTGEDYRLPTEAEWEYAARGGNKSRGYKYAGTTNNLDAYAWYGANSGGETHPVGQKSPNELELYDMSGNVWEWCNDWYHTDYYIISPQTNPKGVNSSSSEARIVRGGGWTVSAHLNCTSFRDSCNPEQLISVFGFGFRIAKTLID